MLNKSTRQRKKFTVNLFKLEKLNKKFKNKIFVVPGKVLGTGNINEKIIVTANNFRKTALKKQNKKGKTLTIENLLNENIKEEQLMIVR